MDQSHARWAHGMLLVILVALIWIAASYVVAFAEDSGLPAFVLTLICNSLFMVFIPIAEFSQWRSSNLPRRLGQSDNACAPAGADDDVESTQSLEGCKADKRNGSRGRISAVDGSRNAVEQPLSSSAGEGDSGALWTRARIAWVSLAICPPWFLAQLTFNLSLELTSVSVSDRHSLLP